MTPVPIHLRNAVSQIQPYWIPWELSKRDAWVREYPDDPHVVTDVNYFPFFRYGMEFEEFVPAFADWFSQGKKTAIVVGIRSDESLNRFRTIRNERKVTYKEYAYTTKLHPEGTDEVYNVYPIYDFKTRDVWIANGKCGYDYNPNHVAPPEMKLLKQITGLAEAFKNEEFSRSWI